MAGQSIVRITSLIWADILVGFAFFVMQNYLTDVWGLNYTHSAAILNFWNGMCLVLPGLCLYLVDTCLGHLGMLVLASISYSTGIAFIAMSTPPVLANATGMCKEYESNCIGHTQRVLFYTGMALVAIGKSGNDVSLRPFLDEQKDTTGDSRTLESPILQILGYIFVVIVSVAGAIALPYIKPWSVSFGIPAICTTFAMLLFFTGLCRYKSNGPQGSPITNVFRVLFASATKIRRPFPLSNRLYKGKGVDEEDETKFGRTRFLRFLEKAAIYDRRRDDENNKWRVCTVAEVEEAKIAVRMIPMWMTFIMCGIVSSIGNTYFVEQSSHLSRKVGNWNVPLQILLLFSKGASKLFENFASNLSWRTVNEKDSDDKTVTRKILRAGSRPAIGIGFAMIFSVLCCIAAAGIEKRRLNVIVRHDLLNRPDDDIPMSVYWLLFPFFLLAGVDSFLQKSIVAFNESQAPESMSAYLEHFSNGLSGLGFMFSVLMVYVVGRVSEKGGKTNWFQPTLNRSRLDKYYWVLAALSAVNLVIFTVVACGYSYTDCKATDDAGGDDKVADDGADDEGDDDEVECPCCCC